MVNGTGDKVAGFNGGWIVAFGIWLQLRAFPVIAEAVAEATTIDKVKSMRRMISSRRVCCAEQGRYGQCLAS